MAGTRVQQDVGGVQSAYSDQTHSIPAGEETRSALNRAGRRVCSHVSAF